MSFWILKWKKRFFRFAARKLLTAGSARVTLLGSLPFDISSSGLSFPAGTEIKISLLNRANSERLMSDVANTEFTLYAETCELMVTYLTLSESSLLSLRHRLSSGPLFYSFLKSSIYGPLNIAAGLREANLTVSRGSIPEYILLALQPVTCSAALYTANCYDFQPNNLVFAQVAIISILSLFISFA